MDMNRLFKEYYNSGKSSQLRFGQWFLNTYAPDTADPELFYERDMAKAASMIEDRYARLLRSIK